MGPLIKYDPGRLIFGLFENKRIFVQMDELHQLDKVVHARINWMNYTNWTKLFMHESESISVADPGFTRGGGANPKGAAPTYYLANFS